MANDDWGIVSVDDHVIEPPDTWTSRVPAKFRDRAPKIVQLEPGKGFAWDFDGDVRWFSGLQCSVGRAPGQEMVRVPATFDDLDIGCWDPAKRVADMDAAHVLASMCFPSMPGFGGTFLNLNPDRELDYACIQAWNDFITEQWCGYAPGRLIAAVMVPYWDAQLAVRELERVIDRDVRAIVFSERPHQQGFPSLFDPSRHWDPIFAAAQEMELVIACHIGSSSKIGAPDDADYMCHMSEVWLNAPYSLTEYIFSGTFERFPQLKVVFSEASIGWMPYQFQVMDRYWMDRASSSWQETPVKVKPSDHLGRNVFGCFIDDEVGAQWIERMGVDAFMCEVDYPHADSFWPNVQDELEEQLAGLSKEDQRKLLVTNAERVFRFTPSGLGLR